MILHTSGKTACKEMRKSWPQKSRKNPVQAIYYDNNDNMYSIIMLPI